MSVLDEAVAADATVTTTTVLGAAVLVGATPAVREAIRSCAPRLVLDVAPGFAEGFSPPAGDGAHFVTRSDTEPPACEAGP